MTETANTKIPKPRKKPWMFEVRCPYCKTQTIQLVDYSKLYGYYSDEKCDQIIEDEWPDGINECEHLAFWSDWAFAGTEISPKWADEIKRVSLTLLNDGTDEDLELSKDGRDLAEYLWDVFHDNSDLDIIHVNDVMRRTLKGYDVKLAGGYVERGAGPQGGGPTYMLIYIRRKTKKS